MRALTPFPYFNSEAPVFLYASSLRFIFHFFLTFTNYLRVKACNSPAVAPCISITVCLALETASKRIQLHYLLPIEAL